MNENPPFSLDSQRTMRGDAPVPARRLRPGDALLNRYTVLSELGEGGMGVVYKCLDQVGGIEVAVKCLPPELSRNEGEMEGIRENYGIVAKLHHSAISGLRNLEKDPATGEYYLVMDLAEGEDLSAILRRRRGRPMPLAEALEILRPLASALDYAHGERVLHRDVKPANVKVRTLAAETQAVEGRKSNVKGRDSNLGPSDIGPSTRLRVQLLDFGLAAEVRSSMSRVSVRGHGGTSGTPAYMAPEQWEARRPDFRTDQYALAVMAYQMLAGFLPFDSEDTDVLRRAVLSRAPDPVEGLSPAANAALLRALSKDPKERFSTCAAFVVALEGRDGSTSRPPDGRAVGASLPATAGGASPSGEPQRESGMSGRALPPGGPQRSEEAARSASAPYQTTTSVEDEAALLLRKAALQEALAAISDADRADKEFALLVKEATRAFRAAEDALKFGRPAVAASCLDRTDGALESLCRAKDRRKEEAERAARAEAERIRRDREAAARAAAERERRREEAARLEAERQREEFDRACADAKRPQRRKARTVVGSLFSVLLVSVFVGLLKSCTGSRETPEPPMSESRRAAVVEQLVRNMVPIPGKDYRMGKYEVTQEEWEAVTGERPSYFTGDRRPVEQVSWNDCQAFIGKLNALPAVRSAGLMFRLPKEEEWEYACRAGASGAYCRLADGTEITEKSLDRVAWFDKNAAEETHPVGGKEPNAFGLYDMHGNVWEWTQTAGGEYRFYRGGSWFDSGWDCETSLRGWFSPSLRYGYLGFRLCASGRADKAPAQPEAQARPSEGERTARSAAASRSEGGAVAALALGSGVSLEMVHCPDIAPDFWMGKFEVTQEQWERVMGSNPSYFNGAKKPVETVSWNDCQDFIRKLNARYAVKESGLTFRLPSEEEWERACRAGSTGAYCKLADGTEISASTLGRVAWFSDNSEDKTHPVGQKEPNAWGLYDMHGNVWEWTGTAVGESRVSRGGSWYNSAGFCESSDRDWISPGCRIIRLGFRLCASGRAD